MRVGHDGHAGGHGLHEHDGDALGEARQAEGCGAPEELAHALLGRGAVQARPPLEAERPYARGEPIAVGAVAHDVELGPPARGGR